MLQGMEGNAKAMLDADNQLIISIVGEVDVLHARRARLGLSEPERVRPIAVEQDAKTSQLGAKDCVRFKSDFLELDLDNVDMVDTRKPICRPLYIKERAIEADLLERSRVVSDQVVLD